MGSLLGLPAIGAIVGILWASIGPWTISSYEAIDAIDFIREHSVQTVGWAQDSEALLSRSFYSNASKFAIPADWNLSTTFVDSYAVERDLVVAAAWLHGYDWLAMSTEFNTSIHLAVDLIRSSAAGLRDLCAITQHDRFSNESESVRQHVDQLSTMLAYLAGIVSEMAPVHAIFVDGVSRVVKQLEAAAHVTQFHDRTIVDGRYPSHTQDETFIRVGSFVQELSAVRDTCRRLVNNGHGLTRASSNLQYLAVSTANISNPGKLNKMQQGVRAACAFASAAEPEKRAFNMVKEL